MFDQAATTRSDFPASKKKIETQVCPQEFMQYTDGVNLNLNERDSSKYSTGKYLVFSAYTILCYKGIHFQ